VVNPDLKLRKLLNSIQPAASLQVFLTETMLCGTRVQVEPSIQIASRQIKAFAFSTKTHL
jgi:hypothetical protein